MRPSIEFAVQKHHSNPTFKLEFDIGGIVRAMRQLAAKQNIHYTLAALAGEQAFSEGRQLAQEAAMERASEFQRFFQAMHDTTSHSG